MTLPTLGPPELEFRRENLDDTRPAQIDQPDIDETLAGIRCPICRWNPSRSSRWTCWDCDYPESFDNGCGTEWNTFETRGLCPTCPHQWIWTSCLSCWGWSKHEDWYSDGLTSAR